MDNLKIIDKDGVWLHNTGVFPIVDYGREGDQVALPPGMISKIKPSAFLKGQPTLVEVDDPLGSSRPAKEVASKEAKK